MAISGSATEFGVLLSPSRYHGFAQLPSILHDRRPADRIGAGLIFWSLMQALTGVVNSPATLLHYALASELAKRRLCRRGKSITDWYVQKERGTAVILTRQRCLAGGAPPALVLV